MRLLEIISYVAIATIAFFLIRPHVRENWPLATRLLIKYVSPIIVFLTLAFYYVRTGENLPDTLAKTIFCWTGDYKACSPSTSMTSRADDASARRTAEEERIAAIADAERAQRLKPRQRDTPLRLPAPKLLSPQAGAELDQFPRLVTLVWEPVYDTNRYLVEIDWWDSRTNEWKPLAGRLGRPASLPEVTTTTYQLNFIGAQPGRWRITAVAGDTYGAPSQWREFRFLR